MKEEKKYTVFSLTKGFCIPGTKKCEDCYYLCEHNHKRKPVEPEIVGMVVQKDD